MTMWMITVLAVLFINIVYIYTILSFLETLKHCINMCVVFFLFNRINKISQRNWCIQYITHRRLWIIKAPTPTHNRAPTPARPTQVNVPNPAIILEVHEVVQDCVLIYLTSYVYFIRLGLFVMFRVKGFGIRRYVFKRISYRVFLGSFEGFRSW